MLICSFPICAASPYDHWVNINYRWVSLGSKSNISNSGMEQTCKHVNTDTHTVATLSRFSQPCLLFLPLKPSGANYKKDKKKGGGTWKIHETCKGKWALRWPAAIIQRPFACEMCVCVCVWNPNASGVLVSHAWQVATSKCKRWLPKKHRASVRTYHY